MKRELILPTIGCSWKAARLSSPLDRAMAAHRLGVLARTAKAWLTFFGLTFLFFMTGCSARQMAVEDAAVLHSAAKIQRGSRGAKTAQGASAFLDMDRAAFAPVVPEDRFAVLEGLDGEDGLDDGPDEGLDEEWAEGDDSSSALSYALSGRDFSGWDIVQTARSMRGKPYRRGGLSPETGFDCSGFSRWAFQQHGVDLPRPSWAQYKLGKPVDMGDLQPGDLLFFKTTRRGPSLHVTIYAGQDTFIHSPQSGGWVEEVSIHEPYWKKRYRGARRVLGAPELSGMPKSGSGS